VLSAALSYSAIPANKPTTPAAASTPAVPVVAEQVKSSDVPIYLGGIGTVQAYPQTMASTVASPLELQFGQIPGVAQMTSSSTLGETVGNLQFAMSRRIDGAAADVLAAINAANGQLPPNMTYPATIRKVNPADTPILVLALTSDAVPLTTVDAYAENILMKALIPVPACQTRGN
jgi:Cu/Ag efflux pump CusA